MADPVDNRPPNERIAAHYRDLIASGALPAGTMLSSNKILAAEWKVSPGTVEKAMAKLRTEGLVRGIHGIGTEVIGHPVTLSSGSQRQDRGQQTGSSWGTGERSDSHTGALVPAPEDVAQALGIKAGDSTVRRTRVYRDSHGVVAHSTSWIPGELAAAVPELARGERLQGGTSLDLIARATGRRAEQRRDRTGARIATAEDLVLLELGPNTVAAILVMTASFIDRDGRVLEYGVDLGAPGRTREESSELLP
ncbi:GntR family transcriptional regulator [Kitasatospora sp. NPDC001664]